MFYKKNDKEKSGEAHQHFLAYRRIIKGEDAVHKG